MEWTKSKEETVAFWHGLRNFCGVAPYPWYIGWFSDLYRFLDDRQTD